MSEYQIHKAAGIIIQDRQLLVERSFGKQFFIAPGGKVKARETPPKALIRELREEFGIETIEEDFEPFGTYYADAAGQEHLRLREDVFMVKKWIGEVAANSEVEEIAWITSSPPEEMKIGSTLTDEIMPRLKKIGLLD
ncbi:NUDIX domain-containing protein [Candidatus Saccharibacteria bacterium]|nr:NUDIX domain-containing protein [Candidatus Saccharibacteria bacterium]